MDWLNFYTGAAIQLYLIPNGILGSLQIILGVILIRDALPSFYIPVFSLGTVITEVIARILLHQSMFSSSSFGLLLAGGCCILSIFKAPTSTPSKRSSNAPKLVVFGIVMAFMLHLVIFGVYFLAQDHQPIISFMDRASLTFHDYATSAGSSLTLRAAVEEYHLRYGRPPPPGFDAWFKFATERDSKVIDEYDQIVEDLRPFWGIEPSVLRERVARVASNPWNNVGQISVRNHKAEITVAPQWLVYSAIVQN
jgi:hypothetical protein